MTGRKERSKKSKPKPGGVERKVLTHVLSLKDAVVSQTSLDLLESSEKRVLRVKGATDALVQLGVLVRSDETCFTVHPPKFGDVEPLKGEDDADDPRNYKGPAIVDILVWLSKRRGLSYNMREIAVVPVGDYKMHLLNVLLALGFITRGDAARSGLFKFETFEPHYFGALSQQESGSSDAQGERGEQQTRVAHQVAPDTPPRANSTKQQKRKRKKQRKKRRLAKQRKVDED